MIVLESLRQQKVPKLSLRALITNFRSTIRHSFKHNMSLSNYAYNALFAPRMLNSEHERRREYLTNVLLAGLATLFFARLLLSLTSSGERGILLDDSSWVVSVALLVVVSGFWSWSRRGHVHAAALGVISLLTMQALSLIVQWGFNFPLALLMTTVVVLAGGVLLATRYAIAITLSLAIFVVIIQRLQQIGTLTVDSRWSYQQFTVREAVGLLGVIGVIALVTWIMNSEVSRSISRMTESEAALAHERDKLEERVAARTEQLEKMQLAHTLELQRFAEFGRLSANLLHEISNPLTAAYLNLASYEGTDSQAVKLARKNLKQLERYTLAARSQLKESGTVKLFSIKAEIHKIRLVIDPLAAKSNVHVFYSIDAKIKLYGDPVKFTQIVSNIVINAIDAYDQTNKGLSNKTVYVTIGANQSNIELYVQDFGIGISQDDLESIFIPFYSTKHVSDRGLGIGLPMVKRMVEEEFSGSIRVTSNQGNGTVFNVSFGSQQPTR